MTQIIESSDDGQWGVVVAGDLPPGIARSKTRDTPTDALNAPWDPALTQPVGPGSLQKYVKVRLKDIGVNIPLSPAAYANGAGKKKFISDYPHTCPVCGGPYLMLFSSMEHPGGKPCPGPEKGKAKSKQ